MKHTDPTDPTPPENAMTPEEFMDIWCRMSLEERQAAALLALGMSAATTAILGGITPRKGSFDSMITKMDPNDVLEQLLLMPGMPFETQASQTPQDERNVATVRDIKEAL